MTQMFHINLEKHCGKFKVDILNTAGKEKIAPYWIINKRESGMFLGFSVKHWNCHLEQIITLSHKIIVHSVLCWRCKLWAESCHTALYWACKQVLRYINTHFLSFFHSFSCLEILRNDFLSESFTVPAIWC